MPTPSSPSSRRVRVVDSHTGGEPTRTILLGELTLSGATMRDRRDEAFACYGELLRGMVREPRGADVWVGALLTPPVTKQATVGVIFFTTVGPLGMCGHGTMGVVHTLRHLGMISPDQECVHLDTPIGTVKAWPQPDGSVRIQNVVSGRYRADVEIEVPEVGRVSGDIAYGGNWFYLVRQPQFAISWSDRAELTRVTLAIRSALAEEGITGSNGEEIDHVELFGTPDHGADSRSFVLCPGGDFDRSPCGTGTSAKLACLAARGELAPNTPYIQESPIGTRFTVQYDWAEEGEGIGEGGGGGQIIPTLTGRAWISAESTLIFEGDDPLAGGIA